ncbi:MAG: type 4a pilus biogenesis protein PilO [Candidatus Omnitrophota bacterium]
MEEKKNLAQVIMLGLAGLFFLTTRLYIPLGKTNTELLSQYRQLVKEVKEIEQLKSAKLQNLNLRINEVVSRLEKSFLQEGKLKYVEQLTLPPAGSGIVFTKIIHGQPKNNEGCQIFPIDISMRASFYDLMEYLRSIETQPLLLGISSLNISQSAPNIEVLDIKISFLAFRLSYETPPISTYLEHKYEPLDMVRLEKLLEPLSMAWRKDIRLSLSSDDLFSPLAVFKKIDDKEPPALPKIEEITIDDVFLKGILRIGEKKAALINDRVVMEGEKIEGMEVSEIRDNVVILLKSGKTYILKMGVENEKINPK